MIRINWRDPVGELSKAYRDSRAYVLATMEVRQEPHTRFFIFGQGRTGSTLLCNLLDGHSAIHCDKEILNNQGRPFPTTYVKGRSRSAQAPVYGFKVKVYQLTENQGYSEPRAFIDALLSNGWKMIYLWRRNIMRQALSAHLASRKGMYHVSSGEEHRITEKMYVNPDVLIEQTQNREQFLEQERQLLTGLSSLEINYEDDLLRSETWPQTTARIFDYLGLPNEKVDDDMMRSSVDDLSEMISNYDEVERAIAASKYAHLI